MEDRKYLSVIDEKKEELDALSDYLWDNAETAFIEFKSAAYMKEALKKEGFTVEENLAGIETAFLGRFGHGRPVVGVLGEFDALSGLAQEAGATEKKPLPGKTCGQGCGHNLLGMGSFAAALGVKRFLEESGRDGTVIFFGCPAEEGGSGKGFMARDGVFDELDLAVTWHPGSDCRIKTQISLANIQVLYRFEGTPSHAGSAPEKGRSALDALELMNVGVQFLREHMSDDCRIHYAITDTGGFSPNVVQGSAEAIYLIRAPKNDEARELYERVNRVAAGAAMMTDTQTTHTFIKACSNTVDNFTMIKVADEMLKAIPAPVPSEEDLAFAREFAKTGSKVDMDKPFHYQYVPAHPVKTGRGSTDVGDVSWVCPTVQVNAATWCSGTSAHTWQATAQGKRPYTREMARYAGKVMAATAVAFIEDPALLEKAQEEHKENVGPKGYEAPIPKDVVPRPISSL